MNQCDLTKCKTCVHFQTGHAGGDFQEANMKKSIKSIKSRNQKQWKHIPYEVEICKVTKDNVVEVLSLLRSEIGLSIYQNGKQLKRPK